jgi:hypothetical protein
LVVRNAAENQPVKILPLAILQSLRGTDSLDLDKSRPGDRRNFDTQHLKESVNSNGHLHKPGDRRNFDTQQNMLKMS